jgi:hypothetical protein
MNLTLPAIALFTELRDTGEQYPRDAFEREFPGADYDAALREALEELRNAGLSIEPGQAFTYDKPRGVLFTRKSARPIRID